MITTVTRYHDFSYGHRIVGKSMDTELCNRVHGHNARVHFTVEGETDKTGHLIEFDKIKEIYCRWLEDNWDHRMLLYKHDNLWDILKRGTEKGGRLPVDQDAFIAAMGFVMVPVNPTAENLTAMLFQTLREYYPIPNGRLVSIRWEETRKCSVEVSDRIISSNAQVTQ